MKMSLRNWLDSGWIVEHVPTPEEISDLLAVVDRDLQDAAVESLSPDWKLGIAYNGALQLAILALAAEGVAQQAGEALAHASVGAPRRRRVFSRVPQVRI
jgi:hypothetical protein